MKDRAGQGLDAKGSKVKGRDGLKGWEGKRWEAKKREGRTRKRNRTALGYAQGNVNDAFTGKKTRHSHRKL